ncbi:MAG: hypothetical protein LBQ10_02130, partial [Desulfovibrio sp.]|nr:hypothetical protein [Desulfovibrio sp.]
MRLSTIRLDGQDAACVATAGGLIPIRRINEKFGRWWPAEMFELIQTAALDDLKKWYNADGKRSLEALPALPAGQVTYAPLFRRPRKIWGIGLNYVEHA